MNTTHKLLVEISSENLLGLVYAIEALKNQPVTFEIIEEGTSKSSSSDIHYIDLKLGKKGKEIIKLLAQGATYNVIAEQADISINGVRYYIKKIFKVLDVNNGRTAVKRYLDLGGEL